MAKNNTANPQDGSEKLEAQLTADKLRKNIDAAEYKDIAIYQGESGAIEFRDDSEHDTVWGNLARISALFGRDKSVISRHIRNILQTGELERDSVVAKIATTAADGKIYQVDYYNLDMMLSVGYRVDSKQATRFRIWATKTLKQHLLQGGMWGWRKRKMVLILGNGLGS